jgi:hypothetical protein
MDQKMNNKLTLISMLICFLSFEILGKCSETDPRSLWECKDTLLSIKIRQINDTLSPFDTTLMIKITVRNNSKDSMIKMIPFFAIDNLFGPVRLFEDQLTLHANEKSTCNLIPNTSSEYIVDLNKLKWQKIISSVWAHEELDEMLKPGCYTLALITGIDGVDNHHVHIGSNIIKINYNHNKKNSNIKKVSKKMAPKEN